MSIKTERLQQEIYKFNKWVRDNQPSISEAIIRHYDIHGEFVATQRKELGYFPYPHAELALLPAGLESYSMGAYNPCKYAELESGDKVLDIGCGVGIDSFLAAGKVGKSGMVIGVDVTLSLLRRGAGILSRAIGNKDVATILFVQASGDALPVAAQAIDVIISNGCLHLLDKPKAFTECFRVLSSRGRAVLADVVAENDNIENFYDNPLMYLYSGGGKQTPEKYESLAKDAGFSEVNFISERQPWDVGDEPMPGGYLILEK
ncbi:MAG: methyltransferase domain-containing protein [Candidatus Poribacteria bacterium]